MEADMRTIYSRKMGVQVHLCLQHCSTRHVQICPMSELQTYWAADDTQCRWHEGKGSGKVNEQMCTVWATAASCASALSGGGTSRMKEL